MTRKRVLTKLIIFFSVAFSLFLFSLAIFISPAKAQVEVPIYDTFEETVINQNLYTNKFDFSEIELRVVFTSPTGVTYNHIGFYAGDGFGGQQGEVWKIRFMPIETGIWNYTISWSDGTPGYSGTFTATENNIPGRLLPSDIRRWKFEYSNYDMPIMIPTRQWFKRTPTNHGIDDFIRWAGQTVRANIIGTTLVYFNQAQNEIPYIIGKEGTDFNISMWDRLNSHYDFMRDRAIGHYIMFYSDDTESPTLHGITACSNEEINLFKYAIARYAAYPTVIWDTGIDIVETRGGYTCGGYDWVEWFTRFFNQNDPWNHPAGNRSGGGSGSYNPPSATYYSDGASTLPAHLTILNSWLSRQLPTIYTDRWRENYGRGNFDPDKIRRAIWEVGLIGGTGAYVSGNNNDGYLNEYYYNDFIAAPRVGHAALFFRNAIRNFGLLTPHDELVITGNSVTLSAFPGEEYVAYLAQGGSVSINIASGDFSSFWYDPRNGSFTEDRIFQGGTNVSFTSPGSGDWTLHILKSTITPTPTYFNPADANSDGRVDGQDYIIWHNNFDRAYSGRELGDYNLDDYVDLLDYTIWIFNYSM